MSKTATFTLFKKCDNCGTLNGTASISCIGCGLLLLEKVKVIK